MVMPQLANTMKKTAVNPEKQEKMRQQLLQRAAILSQLREDIFGKEMKTRFGNIISNAFWGFWPTDEERYVNPKMEDELVVFKKKIKQRFENRDVPETFQFPRIGSSFHNKLQQQHNMIDGKEPFRKEGARSQERYEKAQDLNIQLNAHNKTRN